MYLRLCCTLILTILLQPSLRSAQNTTKSFSRIPFGSCMHENKPQLICESVLASKPNCFIFTGDNIYGDTDIWMYLRKNGQHLAQFLGIRNSSKRILFLPHGMIMIMGKMMPVLSTQKKSHLSKSFWIFSMSPRIAYGALRGLFMMQKCLVRRASM